MGDLQQTKMMFILRKHLPEQPAEPYLQTGEISFSLPK